VKLFGFSLTRDGSRAAPPLAPINTSGARGGWYPLLVREPYAGAWQNNDPLVAATVIENSTVYTCAKTIAQDIAKLHLALVTEDDDGIWTETSSTAFSPVLRKPNRYQVIAQFLQQWLLSKLLWGNAYVLKERDARGVVTALYVLNPLRVMVLVAPDGSIFYDIAPDVLAERTTALTVPAAEVIHDVMVPLFHPLVGVTPIYACGYAANQGLQIAKASSHFFANGSNPGGILLVPSELTDIQAAKIRDDWNAGHSDINQGRIAVLTGGMKYEATTQNAVDSQLIDQLKWTDEKICSCYNMPPFLIGVGPMPPYANFEPMVQQYYAECLQPLMTTIEQLLDDGLGLTDAGYGTEFDVDDLIWLDTDTRSKAAQQAAGALSPNEIRRKFYGVGPVPGGDVPMLQQQYWPLDALANRAAPEPPSTPTPADTTGADLTPAEIAATAGALVTRAWRGAA